MTPTIDAWKRACSRSQERVDKQRADEDSPGWTVGKRLLMSLLIVDLIGALFLAARSLVHAL